MWTDGSRGDVYLDGDEPATRIHRMVHHRLIGALLRAEHTVQLALHSLLTSLLIVLALCVPLRFRPPAPQCTLGPAMGATSLLLPPLPTMLPRSFSGLKVPQSDICARYTSRTRRVRW